MPNLFPQTENYKELTINDLVDNNLNFQGSYLFNFEKGEFVINPDGTLVKCNDFEAYIQWCNKALLTPRYKLAYDDLYGQEFKSIIGSGLSNAAMELEVKRMTIETLMVHPRTKEVKNFEFKWSIHKEELYYKYEIITINDENITLDKIVKMR